MKEKLSYEDRRCLICNKVHVKSFYISLPEKWFFLCINCYKELIEVLK